MKFLLQNGLVFFCQTANSKYFTAALEIECVEKYDTTGVTFCYIIYIFLCYNVSKMYILRMVWIHTNNQICFLNPKIINLEEKNYKTTSPNYLRLVQHALCKCVCRIYCSRWGIVQNSKTSSPKCHFNCEVDVAGWRQIYEYTWMQHKWAGSVWSNRILQPETRWRTAKTVMSAGKLTQIKHGEFVEFTNRNHLFELVFTSYRLYTVAAWD